jgi:hypothetical protein
MKTATKAEYAKLRGMTRQAVYKAIKEGRLIEAVLSTGLIDVDVADREWAAHTNPLNGGNRFTREDDIVPKARAVGINPDAPPPLNESKTLRAAYEAKLAQLEYEEKSEILINADAVKRDAFKAARLTRDAMLAIPDRMAAELAGVTDAFVIHTKMTHEIRAAIAEVVKGLEA